MGEDRPLLNVKKRLALALGLIAIACVTLFLILTEPIDRSPLLGTDIAKRTEQLLNDEALTVASLPGDSGDIRIGWGVREITPPLGAPTYGYSSRLGRGITLLADSVYVKALALSAGSQPPLVFLSADICLWVGDISDRIAEKVSSRLPRRNLFFGATHTHSGPGGYADGPLAGFVMGKRVPELCDRLVNQSVRAIEAALQNLQPGGYRVLAAPEPSLMINRTKASDVIDNELVVVECVNAGGEKFAVVFYGAHATTVAPSPVVCSADYPGALCRNLKQRGYAEAMFVASGTSSAGPFLAGHPATEPGTDLAEKAGSELSNRLIQMSATSPIPLLTKARVQAFRSEIALPTLRFKILGRMLEPSISFWLAGSHPLKAFVQGVKLGKTVIIGHSFEFSSPISRQIKNQVQGWDGKLIITGFNGHHNLYSVPEIYYDDSSLEATLTLYGPGLGVYLAVITEQVYLFLNQGASAASWSFTL